MIERELFIAALQKEGADQRREYLRAACGPNPALLDRVEGLLQVYEDADSFLESPAPAPTLTVESPGPLEGPGTLIGSYKLMEQIGEGGMGVVYFAEQTQPVRRKVALKIIKPGMDTKQVIARFEAERQALAMMDHPNIAKVHDGGATESGRPYFVMELVRGIPITEYCDRERLSIPERLELFVLVCRAVQHAHQKGIIHRDLKPSNILVTVIDGAAVPKVIDFGVAKATGASLTERTIHTGFHQFVGTPLYMSPEQADLSGMDMDTRSDIYSLGVLLYELLTGTTPFDQETFRTAAFDEMRRIIREEEPPKPSTRLSSLGGMRTTVSDNRKADARHLDRTVCGELDWIVMKALEKDRRRRYETANDFAADVMRYLSDKPVEACPPTGWYRLSKLVRRNRLILSVTALVVLSLVAGTAVSAWQAAQAKRARRETAAALRKADARLELARRAVDEMYTRFAEEWLGGQAALTDVQRDLLEKALAFYDAFAAEHGNEPQARLEAILARSRVARIQFALGMNEQAEDSYRRAVAETEDAMSHLPDHSPVRRSYDMLLDEIKDQLGGVLDRNGRYSECWDMLETLLAARDKRLAADPTNPDALRAVANTLNKLANISSKSKTQLDHQRRCIAIRSRLVDACPDNLADVVGLVNIQTLHAAALSSLGRNEETLEILRSAAALAERLGAENTQSLASLEGRGVLARALGLLGVTLFRAGQVEEARERILRATDILEKLVEHPVLANHACEWEYSLLSEWYMEARGLPGLDPGRALALARRVVEQAPTNTFSWKHLALAEYLNGHWDESIRTSEQRLRSGAYYYDLFVLAMAHARKGDLAEARSWYLKAMEGARGLEASGTYEPIIFTLRAEAETLLGVQRR